MKIDAGVASPERMAPGFLNHLELGEFVARLVEKRNCSHTVFNVRTTEDLRA